MERVQAKQNGGSIEGRFLTRAELQRLADVPPETEWFAHLDNENTRRGYRHDVGEFVWFAASTSPTTRPTCPVGTRSSRGKLRSPFAPIAAGSRRAPRFSNPRPLEGESPPGTAGILAGAAPAQAPEPPAKAAFPALPRAGGSPLFYLLPSRSEFRYSATLVPMPNRILHFLLLCLIVLGSLSLPARGVARPDIRVPGVFPDPAKSGPGITAQSPESQGAQPVYGYDWAPAVCKYLYCGDDPVNGVDPSGHESLISLSVASSLGMALRLGYDTSATAAGTAIQKTIFGVQAGKTAEGIVAEYIFETTVAVSVGFVLGKVLGRAFDLDGLGSKPLSAAEELRFVPFKPKVGTRVYRVIRPGGNPYGESWTTVDPRKVKNFADAAGLAPDHAIYQGKAMLVEGRIVGTEGILIGPAENSLAIPARYGGGVGNAGGLIELRIKDATKAVSVTKPPEPFAVRSFHP